MTLFSVTVLVAEDHLDALDTVAEGLQAAGLRRTVTLRATGVITGAIEDAGAMKAMAAVPGVAAVEPAREVRALE